MANNQYKYYVNETDIGALFKTSGLPISFQTQFVKDYVSLKNSIGSSETDIESLDSMLTIAESDIDSLTISFTALNATVTVIQTNLNNHIAASSAHGSTGNIIGTGNYCSAILGGTVLQAAAVDSASTSTVTMTLTPTVAGAGYVQATAQTWVDAINEHKAGINQLKTDLNALITLFNSSLTTETTAKQRA